NSSLYTASDVDLVAVRYPQAGILWEVNRVLTLAATYRHSFLLEIDQGFNINADIGSPGTEPAVRGASLVERAQSLDLFQPSPVPQQDGETSFGDADKHTVSVGAGVELRHLTKILPKPVSADVFVALTYLPERRFYKTDPRSTVGDFTVGGVVPQVGAQL